MGIKFANSAFATLAAGINSSVTSITLTTGQGARFPSLAGGDYFFATLIDTSNNLEIVKCTARSTDVLTVVRGQESTTARAFATGDRIELRVTAQGLVDASGGLASGVLDIPGTSASGAIARLYEDTDNGTNYIGLKAPASVASNIDFTLPSADGSAGQFLTTDGSGVLSFGTVTQIVKKISTYEYSTRTNPSTSVGVAFTWTSSFTMIDRVNNGLLVMAWVPADDADNGNDYTGYGLRFTNGSTNYDTQGRGSNYVGRPAGDLAMSVQQYGFWVSPNSVPTGTLTLQHYLYTSSSNTLLCPNSSDDGRLNQTSAQLIIIEYAN